MAQKVELIQRTVIALTVNTIAGEEITLKSETGHLFLANQNPAAFTLPKGLRLEEGRKYYVSFEDLDCQDCFKRKIKIVAFSLHPHQVNRDMAQIKSNYQ
jgi:hypothetical protein